MIHPKALLLAALALAVPAGLLADPQVDPKRIVNESNSFLKEREPEMTEEEYALYEKVVTMLAANPDFAVKLLEAMSAGKEAPSPAFQFILGNAYYAANQNEKAEANYRAAVARYPNFLRSWVNLGILYYSTGRFAEAVPCFSKAVVLGDRDSATFGLLGYCLQKDGDLVSAEMAYMQALGGDPANVDWKEGLLEICIEGKQFTRAESLVKNLIKERPTDTRYWLADANILLSEGRKVDATVVLETAVGAGLGDATELALLGDLYAEQDLIPEAAETYHKLLVLSPDTGSQKLLRYSKVLVSAGRLKEAEGVLGRLDPAEKGVDPVEFLQAKADLFAAESRWSDARGQVEDILKVDPLNGKALLSLGRTYAAEDNLPRATLAFESAVAIRASTYEASLELANIELKNRHYAKSVEYLQKALNIERTDAVEDYLARVKALVPKES
jgi:tetratricopeptide (TPR) repeat protein